MSDQRKSRRFSRAVDYLGTLGTQLSNLRGFSTMANELIQNADDSGSATWIRFDVRSDALVVDNDGVFSDCGRPEDDECQLLATQGNRCDLHRFRHVAGGDKRQELGTTGAFGIGFTAVYQVTDRPELVSAGRHWRIFEDAPESERIEPCTGCSVCKADSLPGTRFILPWARDGSTLLRTKWSVEPITDQKIEQLLDELRSALPTALLFLKGLREAALLRDGGTIVRSECVRDEDKGRVQITSGDTRRSWVIVRGGFGEEEKRMRDRHGQRIEAKRSSVVSAAIPIGHTEPGLLYATLPTKQPTDLPLHVNADFYTASDRKGVVLETEYQSEWNRAAVKAAAVAVGQRLLALREELGHQAIWGLLRAAYTNASDDRQRGWLDSFWHEFRPKLAENPFVYTADRQWLKPDQVKWIPEEETAAQEAVLSSLDIHVVHPDLRPFYNILTSKEVGVRPLMLAELCQALLAVGLDRRVPLDKRPKSLAGDPQLETLWELLEMVATIRGALTTDAREKLGRCALALARDSTLVPCSEAFRADSDETTQLFLAIDPAIPFLTERAANVSILKSICPAFDVAAAIDALRSVGSAGLSATRRSGQWEPAKLMGWFEGRANELKDSPERREALAWRPIFPCSTGLKPLKLLVFPGDFKDPIGITDVVDIAQLGDRRDFLRDLGGTELTFRIYATQHAPRALSDKDVPIDKKHKLLGLLASRLGELKGIAEARRVLASVPIVECCDGLWRDPSEVYIRTGKVEEVLGNSPHYAKPAESGAEAYADLLRWLGVADSPRPRDVVARIEELVGMPPSGASKAQVAGIFQHIGEGMTTPRDASAEFFRLRELRWLPAKGHGDRWFRPNEDLFAVFQEYLFATQAKFLDIPDRIQRQSTNLLAFLGVEDTPPVAKVVRHLLTCAASGDAVNMQVYQFLSDNVHDSSITLLGGAACLLLGGRYLRPNQVFWGQHQFGRFRCQLDTALGRYQPLFDKLGVKRSPQPADAIDVIRDISGEFGPGNNRLDDDSYAVLIGCWRMLSTAMQDEQLTGEEIRERLGQLKVVPSKESTALHIPDHMFLEDRAGLAARFGVLLTHRIIPKVDGAWPAMVEAGVRSLAERVEVSLVECLDPSDDAELATRIRERRDEIRRVFAATPAAVGRQFDMLERIACSGARELKLQWRLSALGRVHESKPEDVAAYLRQELDTGTLFYVPAQDGTRPYASLARELALLVDPQSGVPPVAWTPQKGGCSMRPEVRFESGEKTAEGLHA